MVETLGTRRDVLEGQLFDLFAVVLRSSIAQILPIKYVAKTGKTKLNTSLSLYGQSIVGS
jgi:hypothetical protein